MQHTVILVDVIIVAMEERDAGVRREELAHVSQGARRIGIVTVQPGHYLAGCPFEALVQGIPRSEIGAALPVRQSVALFPDNLEMKFWHAVSLVNAGQVDESLPVFRAIFLQDARWRELVLRLNDAGLLEADRQVLERLTGPGSQ